MQDLKITGNWEPADSSAHHLELAPTAEKGVIAIRDSFDPSRIVYATGNQLTSMVEAMEETRFRRLLGT